MGEGCRDPLAPIVAALIEKGFDEEAPRVAEDRHQQEDPHRDARDRDRLLTKIDLQLVAGRRFDAHGRQLRRALLSSEIRDGSLNRPLTDRHATIGQQTLHHDRIPGRRLGVERPRLASPVVRPAARRAHLVTHDDRLAEVAPHRIDRDPDFPSDRPLADATPGQGPNRAHHVAVDHRYLPSRRYQQIRPILHQTPPGGSDLVSERDHYHCRSTQGRAYVFPARAGINPAYISEDQARMCLPRARGDQPPRNASAPWLDQVFPARAGINPSVAEASRRPTRLPRARGDQPRATIGRTSGSESSPRARGSTLRAGLRWPRAEVFPARAGINHSRAAGADARRGLPRARGDQPVGDGR